MKPLRVLAVLAPLLLVAGCKKTEDTGTKEPAKKGEPQTSDKDYASGTVQVVVMEVQTKLDVPGIGPEEKVGDEVKKAQESSITSQTLMVSENRGKMVFQTEEFYVPKGTEIRYNPAQKKYTLADPKKKEFWLLSGSEVGNLLEGGPSVSRTGYAITIKDTTEKATVAGVEAVRSDAELGFDWAVKTKEGEKKGKVKVKLAIWHSGDAKLKESWGDMMVDFLTVLFQDAEGQKVVDELKKKVKFPVKWSMEVQNEGQSKEKGEAHPKLVTEAQKLEIKDAPKTELATPPAGFSAATGPYEFGEGGQTVKEEILGKLPAKKGEPPKNVEPPEEEKK
jgi:hypothetical protein